jgi:hypothetical protein
MVVYLILVCDRCVGIVDIPVFGTTSVSSDMGWKFDDAIFFYIMDDIYSYVAIYAVRLE